jgi:hypothetical protein
MKSIDNLGKYPADLIIKLAPLSLIDFKQSLQVAVEYKIKPRTTFQNEIGYINNHCCPVNGNISEYMAFF